MERPKTIMSRHVPLYSVPPEIFLSICIYLSESDFLSLKLSSPHLHQLINSHAAALCNTLICARYPLEAALLNSKLQDGWLVPTHPCVLNEEAYARNRHRHHRSKSSSSSASASSFCTVGSSFSSSRSRSRDTSPSSPWSSSVSAGCSFAADSRIRLDLSTPGPQYLRFLAEYSFEIRVAEQMFLARCETDAPQPKSPLTATTAPTDPDSGTSSVVIVQHDKLALLDRPTLHAEKFGLWVGLYCVRRFLDRLRRVAMDEAGRVPRKGECRLNEHEQALVLRTKEGIEWFYA
jgi:hypothetical protein